MKKIVRCIVFFIIGIVLFQILTVIFVPKWITAVDPASPRFSEFYNENKNSIDVLVIGASDVGRGYSPLKVWENYGITSYNLGTSNQTMSLAYYLLKESVKSQKVKVLVLDMDALFVKNDAPEGEYRKLFDNLKTDEVKIQAINDEKVRADNKISYIFPLLRFHSRWNKLENKDFLNKQDNEYEKLSYKGMAVNNDIKPYNDVKEYMSDKGEKEEISEENLFYIDKIAEFCNKEQIKMLWTEIPSATSWTYARSIKTKELADKYNVEFIDYNLKEYWEELQFDWLKDSADAGNHLNVNGAEKISSHIGGILSEKYNLPNRKNEDKLASEWNKQLEKYKSRIAELEKEMLNEKEHK